MPFEMQWEFAGLDEMQYTREELMCLLDTIYMKRPDLMWVLFGSFVNLCGISKSTKIG